MQDLLELAGVGNRSQLSSPTRFPYLYEINFDEDIAAGGTAEKSVRTDGSSVFVVDELRAAIWLAASGGGSVAFTPLHDDVSPTVASNTHQPLNAIRLAFRTNNQSWQNAAEGVRAPLIVNSLQSHQRVEIAKRVIPEAHTVFCKIWNDSGVAIRGQIILAGERREIR